MRDSTQTIQNTPALVTEPQRNQEAEELADKSLACFDPNLDLEASAYYCGALSRKRVIRSASHLLKLVMVYALTDYSLRMVALWGTVMGWGSLGKSGLRKRLRQCQTWMGSLIVAVLLSEKLELPRPTGMRLRLFDASSVSQPGSHKTDWRLHLGFDLSAGRMTDVQLTDGHQGESLTRWQFQPNEICLADRYSGVPRSLGVLLGAGAWFVIRLGWQNLPLQDRQGQSFSLPTWLGVQSTDPAAVPAQVDLWVTTPQGRFPVRVIARAIPPEKAEQIRHRLWVEAKHKKTHLDERTLLAAGFVMVVSNLPELTWTASQILQLYRFRWQIELVFKRLKSVLHFDQLRAKDPQLAQVYLLTKLLVALLLTEVQWRLALAAPETFHQSDRPVSLWRLTQLSLEAFRQAVCGCLTWNKIAEHFSELDRYLCDEPRRRKKQLSTFQQMGKVYGF
jgi:hypothetical protein